MSARMKASVDMRKGVSSPGKSIPTGIMEEAAKRFHALVNGAPFDRLPYPYATLQRKGVDIRQYDIKNKRARRKGKKQAENSRKKRQELYLGEGRELLRNTVTFMRYVHLYYAIPGEYSARLAKLSHLSNICLRTNTGYRAILDMYYAFSDLVPKNSERIQKNKEKYNTETGLVEWVQDSGLNISVSTLFTRIPRYVRRVMGAWTPFSPEQVGTIRTACSSLSSLDESKRKKYQGGDGLLVFLEDHDLLTVSLQELWKIIPRDVGIQMQWSLQASTTGKRILSLEQEVLAVVAGREDFYNSTEGFISLAWQLGHKGNIDNFHRKLTLRLAREFPQWKYFNHPMAVPRAHQYLQEWKELSLEGEISLTHYMRYRYCGGKKEKVAPIFPLDTFFERLPDLDQHQIYFGLRCLRRNKRSVRRYQEEGTLPDRILDGALSLDDTENNIAGKMASDTPGPGLLVEQDELERAIRGLPDNIATLLMQIIESDYEMTPAESDCIKVFFRENPDQGKLFRELLWPG